MLRKSIHFILFGAGLLMGVFLSRKRLAENEENQTGGYERMNKILRKKKNQIEKLQSQIDDLKEREVKSKTNRSSQADQINDLTLIDGIGPKTEKILNKNGIFTYSQLAETPLQKLRDILTDAGSVYLRHDPGSWAEQAREADKRSDERSK